MSALSALAVCASALFSSVEAEGSGGATRLVTLGGAVTDVVVRLGHGDAIVGIDSTSEDVGVPGEPQQLGFFRQVSVSGVLSLRPTHVLAVEETGPPSLFDALSSAGVEVTRVETPSSVEGAEARILAIASAVGEEAKGQAMVDGIRRDLASVERPDAAPRVLFVYARGPGTLLVAGKNTGPEAVIRLAGGENSVRAFDGFKPFSSEAVLKSAPEVLLMTSGGLASMGGESGLARHPVLGQTPAVQEGRIIAMDDLRLLGFGAELGAVVKELAERLSSS